MFPLQLRLAPWVLFSSIRQHPLMTSSVPALNIISLLPRSVAVFLLVWLEILQEGLPDQHLLLSVLGPPSHVSCWGAPGGAQLLLAACCLGSHVLSLLSPRNPLQVGSNLQTRWILKVYFAIRWLLGGSIYLPGDSMHKWWLCPN